MSNEKLVLLYQASRQDSERREILANLYKQNIGLIGKVATRYTGIEELEDLKQEAFFGLVAAADSWNPDGGANFASYSVYWMRQAVRRYIDNSGSVVRVSVYQREKVFQYRKVCAEYEATYGQRPTGKTLRQLLKISAEQLNDIRKADTMLQLRSMAEPVAEGLTIEDTIEDPQNGIDDAEEQIQQEQMAAAVWDTVSKLPEQEQECIRERYKHGMTLKETSAALGIPTERVRAIEEQALQRMRRGALAKALKPYVLEDKAIQYGYKYSVGTFKRTFTSSVERAVLSADSFVERMIMRYEDGKNGNTRR